MEKNFTKLTVNLMVENVDDAVAWYKNVLGAQVVASVPCVIDNSKLQWAMVVFGGVSLMLQLRSSLEGEILALKNMPIGGSFTMYIDVEDINAVLKSVKGKAEIVQEMRTTFYGAHEFAIKDCNGYILAFSEHK
ncbi:hypothetical protein A3J90_06710 [candidate division WOR-1 bacterium RIFOXYC2_FULL_37_10]|uniref:Glyoxalase/fosfomycin resistance/dioxygenase domain-containing protein n=1 Tax=candidate division WOR-1 bacterium RIFOXYB2_FULL_37_13 TaxID=1802579 RepID=A0A1F4SKJ6_UNCSA|nr:MAG: hypothetical protein A2310_05325 [candidate division WOR-1 bacterium RIFOXYB2_FULL_37_13]OGC33972.1 MAG: hypothetical protein A3J90_06710 [candidate division WOR-1 bacterium RIFOXYC2_FULL_37_10]